jgi:hypothetical protein
MHQLPPVSSPFVTTCLPTPTRSSRPDHHVSFPGTPRGHRLLPHLATASYRHRRFTFPPPDVSPVSPAPSLTLLSSCHSVEDSNQLLPCPVKVVSHWPTLSPDRLADGRAFTYGGSDPVSLPLEESALDPSTVPRRYHAPPPQLPNFLAQIYFSSMLLSTQ